MSNQPETPQPIAPSNSITLYKNANYDHLLKTVYGDTPHLSNLNDKVSSCIVHGGTWILYEDGNFKGHSSVLGPGRYPHSKDMHLANDELSSLRLLPKSDGKAAIALFEDTEYGGQMVCLTSAESDFTKRTFNDKVSSIIVQSGTWQLFQHANYRGDSWLVSAAGGPYKDGRYHTYKEFWVNNTISSARPVDSSLDFDLHDDEGNYWVENVCDQVLKLSDNTESHRISGSADAGLEIVNHIQGVARSRGGEYIYFVHSEAGKMLIGELASGELVQKFSMGITGYSHPGGIQQVGNLLIVPMANNEGRSKVLFYDMSPVTRSVPPVLLAVTIPLDYCNAWSAGMTTWRSGAKIKHLVAVRGGKKVYLFESNGISLHCPGASFQRIGSEYSISREYEALNLITDPAGSVYMAGFWSKGGDAPSGDCVDVLKLDSEDLTFTMVVDSHKFHCKGSNVHFRWGGGLRITSTERVEALATGRSFSGGYVDISIIKPR